MKIFQNMIKLKSLLLETIEDDVLHLEKSLALKYAHYLEQFHFYYDAPSNSIFLTDIYIKPKYRGMGYGKTIMKELAKFADNNKLPIQLIPAASDAFNNKALRRLVWFYKQLGYIENNGNPRFDDMGMYRMPKI